MKANDKELMLSSHEDLHCHPLGLKTVLPLLQLGLKEDIKPSTETNRTVLRGLIQCREFLVGRRYSHSWGGLKLPFPSDVS